MLLDLAYILVLSHSYLILLDGYFYEKNLFNLMLHTSAHLKYFKLLLKIGYIGVEGKKIY